MGMIVTGVDAKKSSVEAVLIKADGTRVNLGQIAYWHKNPLMRGLWKIKQAIKGITNGRTSSK